MATGEDAAPPLSAGARRLVEAAGMKQTDSRHAHLGVNHWLAPLLDNYGPMAESLATGLDLAGLRRQVQEALRRAEPGAALMSDALISQAQQRAQARGKSQVTERDLAAVILMAAGYAIAETTALPGGSSTAAGSGTSARSEATPTTSPSATRRATPTLDKFGRDLTRAAQEGKLRPVVGREDEVSLVIETLCRRTKRNPVLVGPAGVGKTAIVEGLAQRVVRGETPAVLRGARIVEIQPSALVAGAHLVGELDKRMQALLGEVNQPGLILFIDEVHSMVGAGGMAGSDDMASLLKPALARGDIACIAATTDDEYRRHIEPDAALERRFQPVRVQELTAAQTRTVLTSLRDDLTRLRGVQVDDAILDWLIDFARSFLRNRYFPDKAVDLLEQCVAYAVTQGRTAMTQADAEAVAQRMVGMPIQAEASLATLRQRLDDLGLLTDAEASQLLNRLAVTQRGLDLRPARPNAIVLLTGPSAGQAEALAESIAETMLGAAERVITIDFSTFLHPADVSRLVGAPPGYVGYAEAVPLHRVVQMPWCVLRLENIDACHPQVREVMAQALTDGFLNDGRGKRIYLSDAIVLLTADLGLETPRPLGFQTTGAATADQTAQLRPAAETALGHDLMDQVDVLCAGVVSDGAARQRRQQQQLLTSLAERFQDRGLALRWDDSLFDWLQARHAGAGTIRDWERLVDEHLSPLLIHHLPVTRSKEATVLMVRAHGGSLELVPVQNQGGS